MGSVKDKRVSDFRTICEVHREIYEVLTKKEKLSKYDIQQIIDLLEEAYKMGKKMNNKLRQYKENYDEGWWEENRNITEKLKDRGINSTEFWIGYNRRKEKNERSV